jgi:hypothetical protein
MENFMLSLVRTIAAASLAMGFVGVSGAHADVLLAKSRINSYSVPASLASVPLDDKGNTVLNFETNKKGVIVITYNVECAAEGNAGNWIGLQIFVDGKLTNPKAEQDDFAICSATGGTEIYTAVSRQSYIKVNEGPHSVEVKVSRQGVTSGRLDDSSIVIMD